MKVYVKLIKGTRHDYKTNANHCGGRLYSYLAVMVGTDVADSQQA